MSKLFSALSLLDEQTSIVTIESTDSYNDDSYFIETLDFLSNKNREFTYLNAALYKGINESSGDAILIRESFSDFFDGIKKFIKSIIKFLKNLLAKFWVRINSLFMRDKYIEQHKGDLAKFSSIHEFDIRGYTFKFEEDVPSINPLQKLDDSIADFKDASGKAKGKDAMKTAYDSFLDTKNGNSYMDDIRKACIKAKSNISETDFKDELFKIYRSGDSSTSKISVTNAIVTEALSFFTNYDKMKTSTQRHSDNIEKKYNEIQKKLDSVNKITQDGKEVVSIEDIIDGDTSSDKIALYDLFMKAKSQEITTIANMHLMAFSAKLDALKDCYGQDKSILYGAFKKILAKNEAVVDEEISHNYNPYAVPTDDKHDKNHHLDKQYVHDPHDSPAMKERKDRLLHHALKSTLNNESIDLSLIPNYVSEVE